jgi:hypothetical protein
MPPVKHGTINKDKIEINIFLKPIATDTTLHYNSNHSIEHKQAAYRFLLNRMHQLPLSQESKNKK